MPGMDAGPELSGGVLGAPRASQGEALGTSLGESWQGRETKSAGRQSEAKAQWASLSGLGEAFMGSWIVDEVHGRRIPGWV